MQLVQRLLLYCCVKTNIFFLSFFSLSFLPCFLIHASTAADGEEPTSAGGKFLCLATQTPFICELLKICVCLFVRKRNRTRAIFLPHKLNLYIGCPADCESCIDLLTTAEKQTLRLNICLLIRKGKLPELTLEIFPVNIFWIAFFFFFVTPHSTVSSLMNAPALWLFITQCPTYMNI